jgi:hypothetical protein
MRFDEWISEPDGEREAHTHLGHRNIQNTTRYTALAPNWFKGFWRD